MTPNTDKPAAGVSLDNVFSPPSWQRWVEAAVAGITGDESTMDALRQLQRTTLEGIPVEVLYASADVALSFTPDRKPLQSWDNRLCIKNDNETQASNNILQGLRGGVTSIELHTCSPSYIASALTDVRLDLANVSLRSADQYETCAQTLFNIANRQGIDNNAVACSVNADPLSTAINCGATESDLSQELNRMAEFTLTAATNFASSKCVLVDAALHHNAGASTIEELHAALATATLYLETLLDAGMLVDDACKQIVFQVAMDADVLLGVAKLRALRALWQHIVDQIGHASAQSAHTTIVAETSHRFVSKRQPWNNHLRNLCGCTAAMLGSADTIMVHPHDVLLRADTRFDTSLGDRIARNIVIILERECGMGKVTDPLSGSYAIENLTQQLMQRAWQSLASTDTGKGWVNELLSGKWQTRLKESHTRRLTLMQEEQRIVVGVNRFVQSDETEFSPSAATTESDRPALHTVRDAEAFEQPAKPEASS
ncbi:MAG: methylmalonyl-CoA mutase family protein [Granulosicoccus sp.]